ncbi:MAG TPA: hypothetical protein VK528_13485 [Flavobacterium sp.]|nr:hypothetical protein [Flavobacterium sp.]
MSKTDSLRQVLSRYEAANKNRTPDLRDSVKVRTLQKLILHYVDSEPKTALVYSLQLLALSQKIKFQDGIADGHLFIGRIGIRGRNPGLAITVWHYIA